MDEAMKAVALEYLKLNVSDSIINVSEEGAEYLLDKHYPGGYLGFKADYQNGYKS